MKFKIEEFPNPEIIDVHISKRLADEDHITFFNPNYTEHTSKYSEELKDVVKELFQIP